MTRDSLDENIVPWSRDHAIVVAVAFADSDWPDRWPSLDGAVRQAVVDSLVMDQLRGARTLDSTAAVTYEEICSFREELEQILRSDVAPEHYERVLKRVRRARARSRR